jgi:hypothetical protein
MHNSRILKELYIDLERWGQFQQFIDVGIQPYHSIYEYVNKSSDDEYQ